MRAAALAVLFVLDPAATAWPATAAQAAGRILNLATGARQAAMGQAGTGLADDVNGLFYNPAGLSQLLRQEAGFLHAQYAEGITYENVVYAHPTARLGTWAGNVSVLDYGAIAGFDENNTPTGNVSASDLQGSFAWGGAPFHETLPGLETGLAFKILREKLDAYSATAYAADLGLRYRLLELARYSFWAGLAERNLGSQVKFVSQGYDLPRTTALGIGFKGFQEAVSADIDAEIPSYGGPTVGMGVELWTLGMLAWRLGVTTRSDLGPGVTGGVGIKLGSFQLDYAVLPYGAFGYVHRGGVIFRFAGRVGDLYDDGLRRMSEKRYAEAISIFTRILTADPESRRALMRLRECQRALAQEMKPEAK